VTEEVVIIDSSVFVAIFKNESEADRLVERAAAYKRKLTSAATWLESAIVCERAAKHSGGDRFERISELLGVEIAPFTAAQARLALDAFKRFGKGRRGKASLNFGDCFVYALAKEAGARVLFKGDDFAQTDLQSA
jgi:ribonuclease VapC